MTVATIDGGAPQLLGVDYPLQAVVDDLAAAGGGAIDLHTTYETFALNIKSGVRLRGTGTLRLADGANGRNLVNVTGARCGIEGLTVDGRGVSNHTVSVGDDAADVDLIGVNAINAGVDGFYIGDGSAAAGPTGTVLDRCRTSQSGRQGISVVACGGVTISKCISDDNLQVEVNRAETGKKLIVTGSHFARMALGSHTARCQMVVSGNVFSGDGSGGVAGQIGGAGTSGYIVKGNTFAGGVRIVQSDGVQLAGNLAEWIALAPSTGTFIRQCQVVDNQVQATGAAFSENAAVVVMGTDGEVTVRGNIIVAPSMNGIVVRSGTGCRIADNDLVDPDGTAATYGIHAFRTGTTNIVALEVDRNRVRGFDAGVRFAGVTGGTVVENRVDVRGTAVDTGAAANDGATVDRNRISA